jgi:hypothetical protein
MIADLITMAGIMITVATTGTVANVLITGEITVTLIKEVDGIEVTATEKADFKPNIYC